MRAQGASLPVGSTLRDGANLLGADIDGGNGEEDDEGNGEEVQETV